MNKIFKSIWSWTRSCFVAVSEASNSHANGRNSTTLTKRSRAFHFCKLNKTVLALSLLCALPVISETAFADGRDQTLVNDSSLGTFAGDALVIGQIDRFMKQEANVLTQSNLIYKNVTGTPNGLYINDGNSLSLVGSTDGILLADGPVSIYGQNSTLDKSKLIIGNQETLAPTKGTINAVYVGMNPDKMHNVSPEGELRFRNGVFTVGKIYTQASSFSGGVYVDNSANVSVDNLYLDVVGFLQNSGKLHIANVEMARPNLHQAEIINLGELTAEKVDISGYLENQRSAQIGKLTLREGAHTNLADIPSVNQKGAELAVNELNIEGNSIAGSNLKIRGALTNKGSLTVTGNANVTGDLVNESPSLSLQTLLLKTDGTDGKDSGTFENRQGAVTTLAALISEAGSTVTNDGNIKLSSGSTIASTISGTFKNNNAAEFYDLALETGSTFENAGTTTVKNLLSLKDVNSLKMNSGSLSTKNVDFNFANKSDTLDLRNGSLKAESLTVSKGNVFLSDFSSPDASVKTLTDGSLSATTLKAKEVNNNGVIAVNSYYSAKTTNNTGTFSLEDGASFLDKEDTFDNGGTIQSNSAITVNGSLANAGGIRTPELVLSSTGKFISSVDSNLSALTAEKDSEIVISQNPLSASTLNSDGASITVENGSLNVANLNANEGSITVEENGSIKTNNLQAKGVTYTQHGTNGITSQNGWFTDSTLNLHAGTINAVDIGGTLGNNTYNISGLNSVPPINDSDSPDTKNQYKDSLTQLITEEVTSETLVNIASGSVFDVERISLNGNKPTINLKGGALQTSSNQLFTGATSEAIKIDASAPGQTVELPAGTLISSSVGAVKSSIGSGLSLESGNLVIDDAHYSAELVSSVAKELQKVYGRLESITVNFLGTLASVFNIDSANQLAATATPVVLNTVTLYNGADETSPVSSLQVGGSSPASGQHFDASMGFKDIASADSVVITGGKELVLVGNSVSSIPNASYGDEISKLLKDSSDGGRVCVIEGTFTLGTHGADTPSVGSINSAELQEKGSLNLKNGEFAVWNVDLSGKADIASNALLHVNILNVNKNGTLTNNGKLELEDNAGTAASFVQQGTVANKANALFDTSALSETINEGSFHNEGETKSNVLTNKAQAVFENRGTVNASLLNNAGVFKNSESGKASFADVSISGELSNAGTFNVAECLEVSGHLTNAKSLTVGSAEISPDGELVNSGNANGKTLVLHGILHNTGASSWENIEVNEGSTLDNKGSLEAKFSLTVAASTATVNEGTLNASSADSKLLGNLENRGNASFDTLEISKDASYANLGKDNGNVLTVREGAEFYNEGTSEWNSVAVNKGLFENKGQMTVANLTVKNAIFNVTGGLLKAANADVTETSIVVGRNSMLKSASENAYSKAEFAKVSELNNPYFVKEDGDLGLGANSLDFAAGIGAPIGTGRLTVTQNITTTSAGGIAVGNGTWTSEADHADLSNGSLVFGKGSTTVIDSSILTNGKSAFTANDENAKVTVDPTATLVLGNLKDSGEYTIVKGYDTTGNTDANGWTGGWTGEKLIALSQDGTGVNWKLELVNETSQIRVQATLSDVRTVYPDLVIPNIANSEIKKAEEGFAFNLLKDKELSVANKTELLNSAANILTVGGATAVSLQDLSTALDSLENRLSMAGDAFLNGWMRQEDRGNDLWIDVKGGKQKYKSLSASGLSKHGFDTNSFGFVMGFDRKLEGKPIVLGGAFSYNHGSLDSLGNVTKTKNKYDSFGLHAYGAYAPLEKLNLIGMLSWMHNSSDISQHVNAAGIEKAEADVKSNLFSVAARVESSIPVGKTSIVPHAGLRYVWSKADKFDTKVKGKKIWSNKADSANTFQMPIGLALRADLPTASGWMIRPQADVSLIPQFGDTKVKTKLTNSYGASDSVEGEFSGKFGTKVSIGVQAEKGRATFGAGYGFIGGAKGKQDHLFKIEARFRF